MFAHKSNDVGKRTDASEGRQPKGGVAILYDFLHISSFATQWQEGEKERESRKCKVVDGTKRRNGSRWPGRWGKMVIMKCFKSTLQRTELEED